MVYLFVMQTICFIMTKFYLFKYNYSNWNVTFSNFKTFAGETDFENKILRFSNLYLKNSNILFDLLITTINIA